MGSFVFSYDLCTTTQRKLSISPFPKQLFSQTESWCGMLCYGTLTHVSCCSTVQHSSQASTSVAAMYLHALAEEVEAGESCWTTFLHH